MVQPIKRGKVAQSNELKELSVLTTVHISQSHGGYVPVFDHSLALIRMALVRLKVLPVSCPDPQANALLQCIHHVRLSCQC